MERGAVTNRIHRAITRIWLNEVRADYHQRFLLREDALKVAFYHHLRSRLGDGWLRHHRLRIFPELTLPDKLKVDLAIVRVQPAAEMNVSFLGDAIEEYVAFIEFKYKWGGSMEPFKNDVRKLKRYALKYPGCLLYVGFIYEALFVARARPNFFSTAQRNGWAKGRVTELAGYWEEPSGMLVTAVNEF